VLAAALAIDGLSKESEVRLLYRLATEMPDDARVVEIGSWKGRTAVAIRAGLASSAELWAVDTWEGDEGIFAFGLDPHAAYEDFKRNTSGLDIAEIRASSLDAARRFEDRSLDWVFIDADHAYRAVRADIAAWAPKLRDGGLLSGHDYGRAGVTDAVRIALGDVQVEHSIWMTRGRPGFHPGARVRIAARKLLRR
jgi:predicted O-methyltransferase YrrM